MLKDVLTAYLLNESLGFPTKTTKMLPWVVFQNIEPTEILMYAF